MQFPTLDAAFLTHVTCPRVVRGWKVVSAMLSLQRHQAVPDLVIGSLDAIQNVIDDQERGEDEPILKILAEIVGM